MNRFLKLNNSEYILLTSLFLYALKLAHLTPVLTTVPCGAPLFKVTSTTKVFTHQKDTS